VEAPLADSPDKKDFEKETEKIEAKSK
jgi:hypothetical protein